LRGEPEELKLLERSALSREKVINCNGDPFRTTATEDELRLLIILLDDINSFLEYGRQGKSRPASWIEQESRAILNALPTEVERLRILLQKVLASGETT
jgi:hypothetical protein